MALTRVIVALFAVLFNLTLAGPIYTGNSCWQKAIELSGCANDAFPQLCACAAVINNFGGETIAQWDTYCLEAGESASSAPEQVCANFATHRVAAPAVTAIAERAPEQQNQYSDFTPATWHSIGFCGVPGQFCYDADTGEPNPVEAAAPTITALAVRNAEPQLTTVNGNTLNPIHSVGFCGLPGMFCPEADVVEPNDVEAAAPTITAIAARNPEPQKITTFGNTLNPIRSMGFCGPPGMFCAYVTDNAGQRHFATENPPAATPSLKGSRPNPDDGVPVVAFPTMNAEKRQQNEAPLPLTNTKLLIEGNQGPKTKAELGWKFVLGFMIAVFGGFLVML